MSHRRLLGKTLSKPQPNTFIGGVASLMPTAADFSFYTGGVGGTPAADIQNYTVVGSDVWFYVDTLKFANFYFNGQNGNENLGNNTMTFIYHLGNNPVIFGNASFNWHQSCAQLYFKNGVNDNVATARHFRNFSVLKYRRVDFLNRKPPTEYGRGSKSDARIYIGNTPLGVSSGNDGVFASIASGSRVLYTNIANQTNNSGSPDGDISVYLTNSAGSVTYIPNTTIPSAVTDLSYNVISGTTIELLFTAPSSANAISFYEVYVDDGTPYRKFYPAGEIAASGGTINLSEFGSLSGLKVKLATCDIYWNGSGLEFDESRRAFSNTITLT